MAEHPGLGVKPTLGCIVRYVGRYGVHAPRAAIVTCTQADVVAGTELAPLDDDMHVHLTVFTPSAKAVFAEENVPYDPSGSPGTWSWPPRV